MPTILDPRTNTERDVSAEEFQRLRGQVGDKRNSLVYPESEASPTMRLWDAVDRQWLGKPVPQSTGQLMLREVTLKCSACVYTNTHDGEVAKHVTQVRERALTHAKARLKSFLIGGREPAHQCTGCGETFSVRKMKAQRHLDTARTEGETHQFAVQEIVMRRFSLTENTETVLGTRPAADAVRSGGLRPNGAMAEKTRRRRIPANAH